MNSQSRLGSVSWTVYGKCPYVLVITCKKFGFRKFPPQTTRANQATCGYCPHLPVQTLPVPLPTLGSWVGDLHGLNWLNPRIFQKSSKWFSMTTLLDSCLASIRGTRDLEMGNHWFFRGICHCHVTEYRRVHQCFIMLIPNSVILLILGFLNPVGGDKNVRFNQWLMIRCGLSFGIRSIEWMLSD